MKENNRTKSGETTRTRGSSTAQGESPQALELARIRSQRDLNKKIAELGYDPWKALKRR